ncbi:unnamed protein product [Cyprideis torosa]|uniref:Uncharacterized protein n=1 Tax=Cyprideis torosa TaxID=163714 RepID=A0A7R8WMH8_9CRUS|nr:unnamed protein product [Cyprideis torosa]CAG0899314.1 unnamed protein product [Cyprideis torosa]
MNHRGHASSAGIRIAAARTTHPGPLRSHASSGPPPSLSSLYHLTTHPHDMRHGHATAQGYLYATMGPTSTFPSGGLMGQDIKSSRGYGATPNPPFGPTGNSFIRGPSLVPPQPCLPPLASHSAMTAAANLRAPLPQPLAAPAQPQGPPKPEPPRAQAEGASGGAGSTPQPLTNMKEKNAMCQINDLVKYNRMTHHYVLTNESGPAHAKVFNVTLSLGGIETFTASGPSIKKAQHAAAALALEQTQLKRPPQRHARRRNGVVTPTVELNALATQRGMQVEYYVSKNSGEPGSAFTAIAKVFGKEFLGLAKSAQAAKHRAASKALEEFRTLPPDDPKEGRVDVPIDNPDALGSEGKSPISQIFELALKRDFSPQFEVIQETGPPHLKTFVTKLKCGDAEAIGEGNSKKLSKKRAAEKMLDHLATLAPLPPELNNPSSSKTFRRGGNNKSDHRNNSPSKKRSRNLVKDPKAYPDYGQNIHPVSRLIQVTQARKEKEPVYTLVAQKGLPRHREFTIQVTVGEFTCMGTGPKKKTAKRVAAEKLLELMGYGGGKEKPKTENCSSSPKKTKGVAGRQIAPGLLLINTGGKKTPPVASASPPTAPSPPALNGGLGEQSATTEQRVCILIARELLESGRSETAEKLNPKHPTTSDNGLKTAKEKLVYLSEVTGLALDFTTFPVAKNAEHVNLAYLALSSQPLVATGKGPTLMDSQEAASYGALKMLSSMDLEEEEETEKKESPAKD